MIDAQLHAVPLVRVPLERHAHGHFVRRLPRVELEFLPVAEQHEPVALVDQPDIAALPPLLAAAHLGLDREAGQVRLAEEHFRAAADGVVTRADQDLTHAFDRPLHHFVGAPTHHAGGASPAAFSKSNVHGGASITRRAPSR